MFSKTEIYKFSIKSQDQRLTTKYKKQFTTTIKFLKIMKNNIVFTAIFSVFVLFSAKAQQTLGGHFYGEDAFRFSNFNITGTARYQGLCGTYTALGGDASNGFYNPAGLGFYNRSELSITPQLNNFSNSTTYQDTKNTLNNSNLYLNQLSLVLKFDSYSTRIKSSALSISYSKQAYLDNQFDYVGNKNKSSIQDFFAEKATNYGKTGAELDAAAEFDPKTGEAQSLSSLAYQAFLIDPIKDGSKVYQRFESSLPTQQKGNVTNTGSVSHTNISYGINFDDKTYIGFGLGIANVSYDNQNSHVETYQNGKVSNGIGFYDYTTITGTGINLSVGGIFKVAPTLQIGVNFISPTWYSLSEDYNATAKIDPKAGAITTTFKTVSLAPAPASFVYAMTSPLRASGGLVYFLGNKHGFITADAEYVGYSLMNIKDQYEADNSYVGWGNDQKRAIQATYKDALNLKVGAEYRFDAIRVRAGFNYGSSPYKINDGIDHSKTAFTVGTGYRNQKFFCDVAGVFSKNNSAYTPYNLANTANYASAQIAASNTSIVVSVGTFF